MMRDDMHLMTNLIGGQTSTSNLRINPCTDISYTTYRFWTKKTNDGRGPGCYRGDYRDGMSADFSSSLHLRKIKKLEIET